MRKMKRLFLFLMGLLTLTFPNPTPLLAASAEVTADSCKQALLLCSYDITNEWSGKIEKALLSYYLADDFTLLQTEYLDIDNNRDSLWMADKAEELQQRYSTHNQTVILLGEDAWIFYRKYMNQSPWKDVPVIALHSGTFTIDFNDYINNREIEESRIIELEESRKGLNATILYDPIFPFESIQLINQLQNGIKHLALISDHRQVSAVVRYKVRQTLREHFPHLNLIDLSMKKLSTAALKDTLRHLPDSTGVLFHSWYAKHHHDSPTNNANTMKQVISRLTHYPVMTLYDAGVDNGFITGGHYITVKDETDALYQLLRRIDNGEQPAHMPVMAIGGDASYLNYSRLKLNNINEQYYPKDAIYYEKPISKFERNKEVFILLAIIALLVIIISLAIIFYHYKTLRQERKLKAALQKSDELKNLFISNFSHQIRTPLNAISGFADLLTDEHLSSKDRQAFNDVIEHNKSLLLNLFEDAVDMADIEAGTIHYEIEAFDVDAMVRECADSIKYKEDVAIEVDNDLPNYKVRADKNRTSRTLYYLTMDACNRATKDEPVKLYYKTDVPNNNFIRFFIEYKGKPLNEKELNHLNKKTTEDLELADEDYTLQLPLCRQVIEGMGGSFAFIEKGNEHYAYAFSLPKV